MPYEFFQNPVTGQSFAKEELNPLMSAGSIASVGKEFVANCENSYWAFCAEVLDGPAPGSQEKQTPGTARIDFKSLLSEEQLAEIVAARPNSVVELKKDRRVR